MVDTDRVSDFQDAGSAASPPIDARLIAQIAHELRTPLASLRLGFDLISDGEALRAMQADPKQQVRLLETMGRSLEKLERQIDDMLDIGFLQTANLTLRISLLDVSKMGHNSGLK